jgi:MraZ protein
VTPAYFHGHALISVDAKNRLSVPASFREVVEARSGARTVLVAPHEREPCLIGYDRARAARLQELIERRFGDDFGPERDDFARLAFGASEPAHWDETGRIILSATMKELGEIERQVFFLAAGDYFELWNPQRLLEVKGGDQRLARIVRRLLEARA